MRFRFFRVFLTMFLLGVALPATGEELTFSSGGRRVHADLCRPDGPGPFPAVIYSHGGRGGAVGGAPEETCRALAEAGFVGFSPTLRTDVAIEESLRDVLAAVDHVKSLEFVDPNRIGVIGFSRGGLLTLMAATRRSDLKAFVLMAPAPGRGHLEETLSEAGAISAPVLILVAANDEAQADHVRIAGDVKETLESAGKQVQFILYPPYGRDGHRMFFEVGSYWKDVTKFLKEHLS